MSKSEGCIVFALLFLVISTSFEAIAIFSPFWVEILVYNSFNKVTLGIWSFCHYSDSSSSGCRLLHGTKLADIKWINTDFIAWPQILSVIIITCNLISIFLVSQNKAKISTNVSNIYYFAIGLSGLSELCMVIIFLIFDSNYVNGNSYVAELSSVNNLRWSMIIALLGVFCHTIANFCLSSAHLIQKSIKYESKERYAAIINYVGYLNSENIFKIENSDGISTDIIPRNDFITKILSKTIDSANKNEYERIEETEL